MAEKSERPLEKELRSPRAAAIAGILYSILTITIMVLTFGLAKGRPEVVTGEWFETWSRTASLVLTLVPFGGIAFLWFTGVVRDRLREQEDRFFATIFLSSGIILVGLWFVWGTILGAIMRTQALTAGGVADSFVYTFGSALMDEIIGNYALRMAGVYMTAIASLWTRTGLMPRWLTIVTYVLALGFLLAAERVREARFIFPTWVFVVSVYILFLNYRRTREQEGQDALMVAD